jgi:hypothetical protein
MHIAKRAGQSDNWPQAAIVSGHGAFCNVHLEASLAVTLCMRPGDEPMTWEQFCAGTGPFAVALDGYVAGGPRFDVRGPRVNFNHHEEVDRLATRSTCAQVLFAIRQDMFGCFQERGEPRADVYCNDCDEDVCTSWFLLKHCRRAEQTLEPALNRLVAVEDILDSSAGAYPFPAEMPLLSELAWVFEPYRRVRMNGSLDRPDAVVYAGVLAEVEERIVAHLAGRGRSQRLDTRYERIDGGAGWAMIREVGAQARTGAFLDGIRAYVAVRARPDGRWTYTVGRMSSFVPFDVPAILQALNQAEGATEGRWGGGNTIGGSPRCRGSRLTPGEVASIVNRVLGSG